MKVDFLLIVRVSPETAAERAVIEPFYKDLRSRVDASNAAGVPMEIPPTTQIRWLINTQEAK